ncbi:ERAD-associated protein [Balamuthia mandrillaris]
MRRGPLLLHRHSSCSSASLTSSWRRRFSSSSPTPATASGGGGGPSAASSSWRGRWEMAGQRWWLPRQVLPSPLCPPSRRRSSPLLLPATRWGEAEARRERCTRTSSQEKGSLAKPTQGHEDGTAEEEEEDGGGQALDVHDRQQLLAVYKQLAMEDEAEGEEGQKKIAEAQFRLACLLCLQTGSAGEAGEEEGEGGLSRLLVEAAATAAAEDEQQQQQPQRQKGSGSGSGPLLDLASLDFVLGEGYVLPKPGKDEEGRTRITNWKQWLKAERARLKKAELLRRKRELASHTDEASPSSSSSSTDADASKGMAADYGQALHWFLKSAEQGHPLAQYFVAMMYFKGLGTQQDRQQGLLWLQRSADSGNSMSCFDLGQMLYEGSDDDLPRQDLTKANHYFLRSADLGNANAQYWIGYCLHQGCNGLERDVEKALAYLEKAAYTGHSGALYYLAMMYKTGDGITPDIKRAITYLEEGAKLEDVQIIHCLGDIYFNGEDGVEVDYPKALEYYRKVKQQPHFNLSLPLHLFRQFLSVLFIRQGNLAVLIRCVTWYYPISNTTLHEEAYKTKQHIQGSMYFRGLGCLPNDQKAFYSYQAAASMGHPQACKNLAYMYEHGRGCVKSEHNAKYFTNLAEQLATASQHACGS